MKEDYANLVSADEQRRVSDKKLEMYLDSYVKKNFLE